MRKWLIAVVAGVLLAAGVSGAVAASDRTDQEPAGASAALAAVCGTYLVTNPYAQDRVRFTSDPVTYVNTVYAPIECGTTSVSVPRGRTALVVVDVNAEVACTGPAGQWCLGRVLIGGVEAHPRAPEPSSLSWAHSDPSPVVWESNTFTRSRLVSCPRTHPVSRCSYPVVVQSRNHAPGLSFWIDDLTVHATTTYSG